MFPDLLSRGRDMHQTHLIYLHKLDDSIQLGVFFSVKLIMSNRAYHKNALSNKQKKKCFLSMMISMNEQC